MQHVSMLVAAFATVALSACGSVTMPNAPQDATGVVINSVGDTGFRIDRTYRNRGAAPLISKVDDTIVGSAEFGYATRVNTKPGKTKLQVICKLPGASATEGRPRPFAPQVNGQAPISGVASGGAEAQIILIDELEPGGRYELHCDAMGGAMARAWLTKEKS